MHWAVKRQGTKCNSKEDNAKWFEDYVDREITVECKRVHDAETAIRKELADMRNSYKAGSTTRNPENTLQGMFNGMADSVIDLASSIDEGDGEDEADYEDDS
jgi:hypothetical protein